MVSAQKKVLSVASASHLWLRLASRSVRWSLLVMQRALLCMRPPSSRLDTHWPHFEMCGVEAGSETLKSAPKVGK